MTEFDNTNNSNEEEESILINPKEIEERKRRQARTITVQPSETIAENRAGMVRVDFESKGRFGSPKTIFFTDFMTQHVTDLSLSNPEDLTETIVAILNEIKNKDCQFDLINLTLEEMLEVLAAIKLQFNTSQHTHRWLCDCQYNIPDEAKQFSEAIIDLTTLQYRSIEDVDTSLKQIFKDIFNIMTKEDWDNYLDLRYGSDTKEIDLKTWNKEQELATITVKEPFNYIHPTTKDIYSFRLLRVADIIEAKRVSKSIWNDKIISVKNKPIPTGVPIAKAKEEKDIEIKRLQKAEAKDAITFTNALALIGYNGQELIKLEDKVARYKDLTRNDQFKHSDFLKDITFGIYDERELTCNICGKTERRSLQLDTTPIELLPLDVNTAREQRKSPKLNFYFAV